MYVLLKKGAQCGDRVKAWIGKLYSYLTTTDFTTSFMVASLALEQSYDCPSASEAIMISIGICITWNHKYWHDYNKAKQYIIVYIFYGTYWD